jgi:hypothetical protein
MSEELTAAAALAIERYIAGLRAELALLGSVASTDLVHEVRDMLLDAAREDPKRAFAEMDRLGEPAELAATLLSERGIASERGIPSASWWLLGTAAAIDILVGMALPVAALVNVYGQTWQALIGAQPFVSAGDRLTAIAIGFLLLGFASWFGWRTWAPWRDGGERPTVGMALTGIAVVRIGGDRAVARTSDLAAAGLHPVGRSKISSAVWLVLSLFVLWWSLWMVSAGALDPSGGDAVYRLAGPASSQENSVTRATSQLYEAAMMTDASLRTWPAIDAERVDVPALEQQLVQRFSAGTGGSGTGYEIGTAANVAPGIWTVSVSESGAGQAGPRTRTLTWALRVKWSPDSPPQDTYALIDYR